MFIVDRLALTLGLLGSLLVLSRRVHSQTSINVFVYRRANRSDKQM